MRASWFNASVIPNPLWAQSPVWASQVAGEAFLITFVYDIEKWRHVDSLGSALGEGDDLQHYEHLGNGEENKMYISMTGQALR